MTFEEFFLKKKIDLRLLQISKPDLYAEFEDHFSQMNEKSFDHSKKYWFNDLRKQFHLTPENEEKLKESFKPVEIPVSDLPNSDQGENSKSVIVKPKGFKPKFKAAILKEDNLPTKQILNNQESDEIEKSDSITPKSTGYKPKFKAPIKNEENKTEKTTDIISETDKLETKKPIGFKPKFITAAKKEEAEIKKEINEEEKISDEVKKPVGFKPRFKASQTSLGKPGENKSSENSEPEIKKFVGFKPRFKPGITSVKKEETKDENSNESLD